MDKTKPITTASGIALKPCYTAADLPDNLQQRIGRLPGEFPYVRGAYAGMYRTKPWRIFQLSGYGSPEEEGERIRFLLANGETGFIMEHDRNTGDHLYDVDHPEVKARPEDIGLNGAVIAGVRDYETVLEGIPLETTYGHAGGGVVQHGPFTLACYWTVAKRRGLDLATLPGTGQSDFFLTYLGCVTKQQVPTRAGLRLNADIIEHCSEYMPRWVPVSIAGYNGADTGLNAYQELAAVFANAIEYLDEVKRRGRIPLEIAARGVGGVNFRTGMDILEDIAKLRASRSMWATLLKSRYGITDDKAGKLRIHSLTAGSMMTYQQPLNNIVRGTIMAIAGVFGGTQSLGVSGYDEALSVPCEHAHQTSLRIQQILQQETNLCAVADPWGGSYFMEQLTAELEQQAWQFMQQIEDQGGFLATLDSGWLHTQAHINQHRQQVDTDSGDKIIVGLNAFEDDVTPFDIDGFPGVRGEWQRAMQRLLDVRSSRHEKAAHRALKELEITCRSDRNIMPAMMRAVDSDVTLGEIGSVYRAVFGNWDTPLAEKIG